MDGSRSSISNSPHFVNAYGVAFTRSGSTTNTSNLAQTIAVIDSFTGAGAMAPPTTSLAPLPQSSALIHDAPTRATAQPTSAKADAAEPAASSGGNATEGSSTGFRPTTFDLVNALDLWLIRHATTYARPDVSPFVDGNSATLESLVEMLIDRVDHTFENHDFIHAETPAVAALIAMRARFGSAANEAPFDLKEIRQWANDLITQQREFESEAQLDELIDHPEPDRKFTKEQIEAFLQEMDIVAPDKASDSSAMNRKGKANIDDETSDSIGDFQTYFDEISEDASDGKEFKKNRKALEAYFSSISETRSPQTEMFRNALEKLDSAILDADFPRMGDACIDFFEAVFTLPVVKEMIVGGVSSLTHVGAAKPIIEGALYAALITTGVPALSAAMITSVVGGMIAGAIFGQTNIFVTNYLNHALGHDPYGPKEGYGLDSAKGFAADFLTGMLPNALAYMLINSLRVLTVDSFGVGTHLVWDPVSRAVSNCISNALGAGASHLTRATLGHGAYEVKSGEEGWRNATRDYVANWRSAPSALRQNLGGAIGFAIGNAMATAGAQAPLNTVMPQAAASLTHGAIGMANVWIGWAAGIYSMHYLGQAVEPLLTDPSSTAPATTASPDSDATTVVDESDPELPDLTADGSDEETAPIVEDASEAETIIVENASDTETRDEKTESADRSD